MHDKILISACFLGQKVRYNGKVKTLLNPLLSQWQAEKRLVGICPEIVGGLTVPRAPAEIQGQNVITCDGDDVTKQFISGAKQALALCQQHNIRFALLKESSPSCGSSTIYDGTFSEIKIKGQGVCSQLLREHGIQVFSEDTINNLLNLLDR
jgi:uncharacterized protein YbbK (DUF523 family)